MIRKLNYSVYIFVLVHYIVYFTTKTKSLNLKRYFYILTLEPQSTTLEYVPISELGDTSSVDSISELKGRPTIENVTEVVSSGN